MKSAYDRIEWLTPDRFRLDGVDFICPLTTGEVPETREDQFVVFKNQTAIRSYIDMFGDRRFERILEFGVHEGGSSILLAMLCEPEKLVGIELSGRHEAFEKARAEHPLGDRVKIHWGTSQDAAGPLTAIMEAEFGAEPIDLIIDDAGHLYGPARRAFELSFARLKPGGCYVLEDWGWAHWRMPVWQDNSPLRAQPALSNLVFELAMACASSSHLIERVTVLPWAVFVTKAADAPWAPGVIGLSDSYVMQGRPFIHL